MIEQLPHDTFWVIPGRLLAGPYAGEPGHHFPEFEALMRPLLRFLADVPLQPSEEIRGALAPQFSVTLAMRAELLENGTPRWNNLVARALHHLSRARLVDRPQTSRAVYQITLRGKDLLVSGVAVDVSACMAYPEWHLPKSERRLAERRTRQRSVPGSQCEAPRSSADAPHAGGQSVDPPRWIERCPHCGQANRVTTGTMRCGKCHETFVVLAAGSPAGFVRDSEPAPCGTDPTGPGSPRTVDPAEGSRIRPAASGTRRRAERPSPEEDIRRREQAVRDAEQGHQEARLQLARRQAQLEGYERQLRERSSELGEREKEFAEQQSRDRHAREPDRWRFRFENEDAVLAAAEQIAAERLRRFQRARHVFAEETAAAHPGDEAKLPGATPPRPAESPEAGVDSAKSVGEPTPPKGHTSSKRPTMRFRCALCRSAATFSDSEMAVRTSAEG